MSHEFLRYDQTVFEQTLSKCQELVRGQATATAPTEW